MRKQRSFPPQNEVSVCKNKEQDKMLATTHYCYNMYTYGKVETACNTFTI